MIRIVRNETQSNTIAREFGSEADVERITGRKRRTLQKDRCLGRGLPFYRFGRQIRYDLQEVREVIRSGRVDVGSGGAARSEKRNARSERQALQGSEKGQTKL